MDEFSISEPLNPSEFDRYYELRYRMLRAPWGQPAGSERDELETSSIHLVVRAQDGCIVGCGRLTPETGRCGRIRYMAIDVPYQKMGLGSRLLITLEQRALRLNLQLLRLNARSEQLAFYLKHQYRRLGPGPLLFDQIPHERMEKRLDDGF